YDSGAGNSPFGLGWNFRLASITRKTDKGLPRYRDGDESDVFIFDGAEDLVPILTSQGGRQKTTRLVYGTSYAIFFYRPRIEGRFARIERWTASNTGISHWRCISKDNITTLYGFDAASRLADPYDPRKVFCWLICRTWDDKGNLTLFDYVREDGARIDRSQAHETNRTPQSRTNQLYPKTIRYGNIQPY